MIDDDDLDLVEMDRLITAIDRRTRSMVIAYVNAADKTGDDEQANISFSGGLYTALGLAEQMRHDLVTRKDWINKGREEGQDDDL